jgi:hypothetical protein
MRAIVPELIIALAVLAIWALALIAVGIRATTIHKSWSLSRAQRKATWSYFSRPSGTGHVSIGIQRRWHHHVFDTIEIALVPRTDRFSILEREGEAIILAQEYNDSRGE